MMNRGDDEPLLRGFVVICAIYMSVLISVRSA